MKDKIPKDLKLKIGTKSEKLWTDVVKSEEATVENLQNEVIIHKKILKMAKSVLEEEKRKT